MVASLAPIVLPPPVMEKMENNVHLMVNNKFLKGLVLYNVLLYCVFLSTYLIIDFHVHFNLPPGSSDDVSTIAYYTLLSQVQVMAGEITPKTSLGRTLLGLHVFFSWFVVVLIMVPWSN